MAKVACLLDLVALSPLPYISEVNWQIFTLSTYDTTWLEDMAGVMRLVFPLVKTLIEEPRLSNMGVEEALDANATAVQMIVLEKSMVAMVVS